MTDNRELVLRLVLRCTYCVNRFSWLTDRLSCRILSLRNMKLIVDFMCGRLVRWLRVLGFDAEYSKDVDTKTLLKRALSEDRTVVTRNTKLSSDSGIRLLLLTSEIPEEQIKQVLEDLDLAVNIIPFTRCNVCNGVLEAVPKEHVRGKVPFYTFQTQEKFKTCLRCGRIYWEGTHVEHMKRYIAQVLGKPDQPNGSETREVGQRGT